MIELAYAPYRLQFRHPFGTAHGLRTGTDSVFIRLRRGGIEGFGEATLPPYLDETVSTVIELLDGLDIEQWIKEVKSLSQGRTVDARWTGSPGTRAALMTAYYDLISKGKGISISTLFKAPEFQPKAGLAMVTIGHSVIADIAQKINELPRTTVLKVKLGSPEDRQVLKEVIRLDDRQLFLDANQGWTSVAQAVELVELAGQERLAGIEQPFAKHRWDLHSELRNRIPLTVYGDESIQGFDDLERAAEAFGGVNIKLMKCGGLDVAHRMAVRASELGMRVMLGSMSESALGCGAMAQLGHLADVVDLDGPWLLANDPFEGLGLEQGRMRCAGPVGTGIVLRTAARMPWIPIGA